MSRVVRLSEFRRKGVAAVYFTRNELNQLLSLYSRRVIIGEWKDYAIDHGNGMSAFSIFRNSSDRPVFTIFKFSESHSKRGAYVVGWARRGPTGVIGTNRNDAREVVDHILADGVEPGKPGPDALDALLAERQTQATTYEDWKRIDAAEIAAGNNQRPRVKFTQVDDMLGAAQPDPGCKADTS